MVHCVPMSENTMYVYMHVSIPYILKLKMHFKRYV